MRPITRYFTPLLCGLTFLSTQSCSSSPVERPNVLIVLVDTLRADHLGMYGYARDSSPVLDRFAAENRRFEHAIAPAPWTPPSVASLFTGMYPTVHGVHTHLYEETRPETAGELVEGEVLSDEFLTLAEVFKDNGYRTLGVASNSWIAAELGFDQGFDHFTNVNFLGGRIVNRTFLRELDLVLDGTQPWFGYVHYMEPHQPYTPPPNSRLPGAAAIVGDYSDEMKQNIDLYDGEIRLVDEIIGSLFDALRERGVYRDTIIAFVADHGEQFEEHGFFDHGVRLYREETHVPFVLKAPGQHGTESVPVSLVDLYPTLLELARLDQPEPVQGVRLIRDLERRREWGVFSEMTRGDNHKAFVSGDRKKLILEFDAFDTTLVTRELESGVVGLHDLDSDPLERVSLQDDELLERLRTDFYETLDDSLERRANVTVERRQLSPEALDRLRSVGYIQ